ncbi:hypothetical protein [Acetivibrio cellulolyticus]|uniref:hypothetical protein n=1 Tax=Acetivibrio cellulolyticus TaxID=35830 RepID=UPI0001E2C1F3|nr:hypothetical protein [Acetivibrio cellulolyticus]
MGKNSNVNIKKISIITLSVFVILTIAILAYLWLFDQSYMCNGGKADESNASILQKAITAYMIDTNDKALTFGENDLAISGFERVLRKLHETIKINDVSYMPYLDLPEGMTIEERWRIQNNRKYKGFKITIYTKSDYKVEVVPYEYENVLIFTDSKLP